MCTHAADELVGCVETGLYRNRAAGARLAAAAPRARRRRVPQRRFGTVRPDMHFFLPLPEKERERERESERERERESCSVRCTFSFPCHFLLLD
eukprot:COSAG03_NODE_8557_length_792_cov_2.215007_2_plen_94_part_00